MRKILFIGLLTAALCCRAQAQEIRPREAGFEDYRVLLEAAGYEAFSFDLRDFLAGRYDVSFRIEEYVDGKRVEGGDVVGHMGVNKLLLTDFPEEQRGDVRPEDMADPEAGVLRQAESLTIGFYPSEEDSTANVSISLAGMGRMGWPLSLKPVVTPDRTFYNYGARQFRIDGFEPGRFIPLVFYGSFWYDERANLVRFCGEREIAPDLSSEIVANVPHFYVIGVVLTEKQEKQ